MAQQSRDPIFEKVQAAILVDVASDLIQWADGFFDTSHIADNNLSHPS